MDKASDNTGPATWRERIGAPIDFPLHAPCNVERAMEAEITELRAKLESSGSPVSTAVGEPVATARADVFEEAADILEAMNDSSGDAAAYDNREQDTYELEREHAIADCVKKLRDHAGAARLATPTQAKQIPTPSAALTPDGRAIKWKAEYSMALWVNKGYRPLYLAAPTQVSAPQADLKRERDQFERMFIAACEDLGAINEALGLDPDDGGAEPILAAIEELKVDAPQASAAQEVRAVPGLPDKHVALQIILNYMGIAGADYDKACKARVDLWRDLKRAAEESTSTAPAAMDEVRDVIADLAGIVRAQNGNLHADINELLARAEKALKATARASQPSLDEVTGAGKGEGYE